MAEAVKNVVTKKEPNYWIKLGIVFFIQIFFRFLPNFGEITDLGMAVAGIFIGTLVGWCICDPIWPSFSCLILLGLANYSTMSQLIPALFGHPAVVTAILAFIFGGAVLASGLSDWAGRWLLSRKFLHGKPGLLVAFLIFTNWLLTPYCSIAILILLWELTYAVAKQAGLDRDNNRWTTITIYSLFFVAGVGFYFNWNPAVLSIMGIAQAVDSSFVLNAWPFVAYGGIVSLLLLAASAIALFVVYKPDMTPLKNVVIEEPPKISKQIKATLILIVILLVVTLLPSILPSAWGLTVWLGKFGTIGALSLVIAASLIIRIDGKQLVTMKDAADKGLAWGPIFIMGTALLAAGALTDSSTGVVATLTQALSPIFTGMSPFVFAAVLILLTIILTNFLNNIVIAAIFIPIIYSLADVIGINPIPLIMTLLYACYVAVLLPSANPMVAFLFGRGDMIKKSDIFRYAPITMVTSAIVLIFIAYPLARFFFG